MFERRSLRWPIILAVVLIVLLVTLAVGWVLLNVAGALVNVEWAPLYWILLSLGSALFVAILVGIVFYLQLSIQQISLNQRQSNFIDSVTHELKSPIASLKLYLQTLDRRQVSDQQRSDFHRFMMSDVNRLDVLINHLLDAARLERPVREQEIETVNLAELLEQCASAVLMRYGLPSEIIQLELAPISIVGRPIDLNILFRNLIDNAVKYAGTPPKVQIFLEPSSQEGWSRIRIVDNGPGIPRSERRRVFGRFVRVGNELERSKPGTGLGLYLVRSLVQRMRGRIHLQDPQNSSGTPVTGTQVLVQLPNCALISPPTGTASSEPGSSEFDRAANSS